MTPAMAHALDVRGFTGRKRRWVRLRGGVPTEVYYEKARHGPQYGIGVLFGWPGIQRNVADEFCCLQVSQRESAGERGAFYYDFSDPNQRATCEREFFAVTIPLIDRFDSPDDLVEGLFEHRIIPSHSHDQAAAPLAAWDVVQAWSLDHLRPRLWDELRRAAENREAYDRLLWFAHRFPEDRPGLAAFLASVPVPPASVEHRLRDVASRITGAFRRRL